MWWLVRVWVPIAIAVTGILATSYVAIQQNYRQSLNDPQISLAEDTAAALLHGAGIENALWRQTPLSVSTSSAHQQIDIASSLSPWVAYYDAKGNPLDSTGVLAGNLPKIPLGVLEHAHANANPGTGRENRVTWQPQAGVRQAVVVVALSDTSRGIAYVAAGRNMREVEAREWQLELITVLGWLATLLLTFISTALAARFAMYRNE